MKDFKPLISKLRASIHILDTRPCETDMDAQMRDNLQSTMDKLVEWDNENERELDEMAKDFEANHKTSAVIREDQNERSVY